MNGKKASKLKFTKVAIIGMGFMGGSLGFDLNKLKTCGSVIGIGRNEGRLRKAKVKRACTHTTRHFEEGVKGADLVVISLPVLLIPQVFSRIKPYLEKHAIVTDMGSTKSDIVSKIDQIDSGRNFVGSHPMVGSEKTGILNIKPGLYKGGTCVVTPSKKTSKIAEKRIVAFWRALGMKVIVMSPEEHDRAAGRISHFPHLASFVMTNMAGDVISKNRQIIGPGFKDATRIAASSEDIWAEVFLSNKKEVLKDIDTAIEELDALSQMIYLNKVRELKEYIKKARLLRGKV
jgi:prephenate dehydrogenase